MYYYKINIIYTLIIYMDGLRVNIYHIKIVNRQLKINIVSTIGKKY